MSSYSTQTVAQLKELLKAKGLSTSGVKSDLIARLEEADAASVSVTKPEPVDKAPVPEPEATTTDAAAAPKQDEDEELLEIEEEQEPKQEEAKEPEPAQKVMTPEERKAAAVELITKRIQRAKKFGTEEDVTRAERDLARVEKFGVEVGTALAREIGIASSEGLRERHRGHNRKHHRHGRNGHRGFKNRR